MAERGAARLPELVLVSPDAGEEWALTEWPAWFRSVLDRLKEAQAENPRGGHYWLLHVRERIDEFWLTGHMHPACHALAEVLVNALFVAWLQEPCQFDVRCEDCAPRIKRKCEAYMKWPRPSSNPNVRLHGYLHRFLPVEYNDEAQKTIGLMEGTDAREEGVSPVDRHPGESSGSGDPSSGEGAS